MGEGQGEGWDGRGIRGGMGWGRDKGRGGMGEGQGEGWDGGGIRGGMGWGRDKGRDGDEGKEKGMRLLKSTTF